MFEQRDRNLSAPWIRAGLLTLAGIGVLVATAAAQTRGGGAPIFRHATFETGGELRRGATEGDGDADIVDVHNAILALRDAGFFLKSVSATVGPDDEIVMTELLENGDPNTHEAELAVVIGKRMKNASEEDVPDPHHLATETELDGEVHEMPNANTSYMKHRIPAALSLLSQIVTLEPGDIVATGVPTPTAQLEAGDTVEITIERLGTQRNFVVLEPSEP